jgi:sec-independent protein translocase protein TatA
MLQNIGTPELLVLMFVFLLFFGGKKLPELARGIGESVREVKKAVEVA